MSKFLDKTGLDTFWAKIKSTFQTLGNLVTAWGSTPSDTKYPSEKLVKDSLDGKQATLAFDGTYNASTNKAATVSTVTNAIGGLDVSSVGGNGKYISSISETDGKISATATTMDTTPTANSTNAATSGGIKTALDAKVSKENFYLPDWTFASIASLKFPPFNQLNEGFFCLRKRGFNVSAVITKSDSSTETLSDAMIDYMFDGTYEHINHLVGDNEKLVVEIRPPTGTQTLSIGMHCYGYFVIGFYYSCLPSSVQVRMHHKNGGTEFTWDTLPIEEKVNGDRSQGLWVARNIQLYYNIDIIEITINGKSYSSASYAKTSIPVLQFISIRATSNVYPYVRKYGNERIYGTFTATEFVGDLNGKLKTARKLKTNLARTADSTFDGSADQTNIPVTGTLPVDNGGTGKTTAKAAEYNLTTGKSEISDATSGEDRVVFELASPSESNGVTRGFRKLSTIWTWIKGLLSSESDVNISGSSASCTGNAATASAAKSGSALETAINGKAPTSHASSATTYGVGTTSNYGHVKLATGDMNGATHSDGVAVSKNHTHSQYITSHQDISGKMNTSASNATAPSGSGGDGATATLLNNLTDGNSDIVTTDDGDNVLIATTDNGGSVTNKWYKRKLVKLIPWIIKKLGTRLVYDCGAGSTSGDDFDAALAAFNAGQWVIIRKDGIAYNCVGSYSGPGLRFKQIANDGSLLKVNTISWTRGSSPSDVTQIEASLSGHTHSQYLTASSITGKMNTNADNAASGALQNLTGQLTEGTSDFTDNTEMFTSYAGNNGFAESGHVNQPYRRKALSMWSYIKGKLSSDSSVNTNGTSLSTSRALGYTVDTFGNGTKRAQIGIAEVDTGSKESSMSCIVRIDSVAGPGGLANSMTILVVLECRGSDRHIRAEIINNNNWTSSTMPVLVTFLSDNGTKMHVCVALANTSNELQDFTYTKTRVLPLSEYVNWTWNLARDSVSTYDYIHRCYYGKADSLSVSAGSANQPVYFNNGVPTACNWWVS